MGAPRSFSIENPAGRLILARVGTPIDVAQQAVFRELLGSTLQVIPGKVVICVDLRSATVFAPDVAEGFAAIMRSDNPKLERSGFLVGESALFGLQIERMIRAAASPARRAFRDAQEVGAWLGEGLGSQELRALTTFLTL